MYLGSYYIFCSLCKNAFKVDPDEYKMRQKLSTHKDKWYFDIGFNIAFTQIIFCIVLIFAQVSPLITIFGSIYFAIKYFIDKYNLLYVFPNEYDG